jgi:hypothetical protein
MPERKSTQEDQSMIHSLKCWPEYFQAIKSGKKTFEIRYNDRNYQVGDFLELHEFDPEENRYTEEKPIMREPSKTILNRTASRTKTTVRMTKTARAKRHNKATSAAGGTSLGRI